MTAPMTATDYETLTLKIAAARIIARRAVPGPHPTASEIQRELESMSMARARGENVYPVALRADAVRFLTEQGVDVPKPPAKPIERTGVNIMGEKLPVPGKPAILAKR